MLGSVELCANSLAGGWDTLRILAIRAVLAIATIITLASKFKELWGNVGSSPSVANLWAKP